MKIRVGFIFCLLVLTVVMGRAQTSVALSTYEAELGGVYAGQDMVPYYMVSNRHGVLPPEGGAAYIRGMVDFQFASHSFSFKTGLDIVGFSSSSQDYYKHYGYLQQLYAEVAWKKWYLLVGAREDKPFLVNDKLSSGNMMWSGNARPVPQIRIGTADFVSVPGTKDG